MRERLVLAILAGLAVIATVGAALIVFWTPDEARPATQSAPSEMARRVVLQDRKEDDALRAETFAGLVRKVGRCDYVTRALMRTRGAWRVSCAPGYAYRLAFDDDLRVYDIGRDN